MFKKGLACALAALFLISGSSAFLSSAQKEKINTALGALIETVTGVPGKTSLSYGSAEEMISAMQKIAVKNGIEFYFNKNDMTFGVKNLSSGHIYTSNPYDAANDPMYTGDVKKNLESQVIISFYDSNYKKQNMWSSEDCLNYGQFETQIYENGVIVQLSLGEDKQKQIVPTAFTPENYVKYTKNLGNREKRKIEAYYTFYSAGEFNNEDMLKLYPSLKDRDLYILEGDLSDREKEEISKIFISEGFTSDKYADAMDELGIKIEKQTFPNFRFRIEYLLDNNGLTVTIPNDSIVCNDGFQLLEINLLPYFGCDKPLNGKNGYLFIPDGSGALININNQSEARQTAIAGRVYGENIVTDKPEELLIGTTYHLPVFGAVSNSGAAFTAIVTSGDEADYIVSLLGGPNGRYYTVYNRFIYTESELTETQPKIYSMGSTNTIYISDKNHYTCDYSVSYYFLDNEKSDYIGMAEVYRDYLKKSGIGMKKRTTDAQIALETIGAAQTQKDFIGFHYKSETVFTTYNDIVKILSELKESGIKRLSVSADGWQKNGLDATISNKIRFSGKQGGKSGYKKLAEYCKKENITLSLSNEFVFVKHNRFFDAFGVKSSAAKTLGLSVAKFSEYRSFSEIEEASLYITSPLKYEAYLTGLTKSSVKNKVETISINSLGKYLVADFSKSHKVNRQEALLKINESLKNSAKNLLLSFDGANAYVLPYADLLEDVPCLCSGLPGESRSVPFLQLAVSEFIKLHSNAVNLSGNSNSSLLDCLRCGVVPSYVVAFNNIEQFKKTDYSRYFAVNYYYVKDEIKSVYAAYKNALDIVSSAYITAVYELSDDVFDTEYSNGKHIYTNYGDIEYSTPYGTVPGGGFLIAE